MLICNARKRCPKKDECPHAIKHFAMKDCGHVNCPDEIVRVKKRIKCKACGASLERVGRKSRAKLSKVKEPLTQYEAQQAVYQLKNMAIVEYRMSGGKIGTSFNTNSNLESIIQGVTAVHLKNIFPNYRERGLDRNHLINYLSKEVDRQRKLQIDRYSRKRNGDNMVKNVGQREMTVRYNMSRRTEKILEANYNIRTRRGYFIYTSKTDEEKQPSFSCTKGGRMGATYELFIPKKMIAKEVQKHLVVCSYYDKNEVSFPCFALIGERYGFQLVPTMVENGRFTDPMFTNGESKIEIKERKRRR